MRYCCPGCERWVELDDERTATGQHCNYCFAPVRVASGLLEQIAAERVIGARYDLRGAACWPPAAQKYLEALRRQALRPKPPRRTGRARWMGPLACAAILLVFAMVAQIHLGHRSAYAQANMENAPLENDAAVSTPPLIPEAPRVPIPARGVETGESFNHDDTTARQQ